MKHTYRRKKLDEIYPESVRCLVFPFRLDPKEDTLQIIFLLPGPSMSLCVDFIVIKN